MIYVAEIEFKNEKNCSECPLRDSDFDPSYYCPLQDIPAKKIMQEVMKECPLKDIVSATYSNGIVYPSYKSSKKSIKIKSGE